MERKITPQEKYNRDKTITVNLRLVKSTETDIIEKLLSEPNKSGYIKRLIREDIARSNRVESDPFNPAK